MTAKTLYSANPAMFRNNPVGFVLAVILCLVGIGLIILLVWWLKCKGTQITVTEERTILRRGILSKSLNEVWHEDVRNVQMKQSFFQRIFGVGAIGISSSGQSGVELAISGIPDPEEMKSIIDRYKREID